MGQMSPTELLHRVCKLCKRLRTGTDGQTFQFFYDLDEIIPIISRLFLSLSRSHAISKVPES